MSSFQGFLSALTADGVLLPKHTQAIEDKRSELEVTDEQYQEILEKLELTEERIQQMQERGELVVEYQKLVLFGVGGEVVEAGMAESHKEWREEKGLTDFEHALAIGHVGWSVEDYDKVAKGEHRVLGAVTAFLQGMLMDTTVEFQLAAQDKLIEITSQYGVSDTELTRLISEMGLSRQEFDDKRQQLLQGMVESMATVEKEADEQKAVAEKEIERTNTDIKNLEEQTGPAKQARDDVTSQISSLQEQVEEKKTELKKLQVRVNVVKNRILEREKRMKEMEEGKGPSIADTEAERVKLQSDTATIRREKADKERDIVRLQKALETNTAPEIVVTTEEQSFMEFHRMTLTVKLSVQNHETSNTTVEELWAEAKNKPKEQWKPFLRAKLVPVGVEGHPNTRDPEQGLLDWLVGAISGVE